MFGAPGWLRSRSFGQPSRDSIDVHRRQFDAREAGARLSTYLDGLPLSYVREECELAGAVDLNCELPLVLGTKMRCPPGEDLPESIHVLLQLFRLLVVQGEIPLANTAFPSSLCEHELKGDLLLGRLVIRFGGRGRGASRFFLWLCRTGRTAEKLNRRRDDLDDLPSFTFCSFERIDP